MKISTLAASFSGTMAITGVTTVGGNVVSDTDSTDSLGSTGVRWAKVWTDDLASGTLTATSGSITDSSGAIDFGNENLSTAGNLTLFAGNAEITSGNLQIGGAGNTTDILSIFRSSAQRISMYATVGNVGVVESEADLELWSHGVNAVTFDSTQDATFAGNIDAVAGGINLGATGAANLLNDYEEGTFTPVLEFGGASVGLTYGTQYGSYTKVGNRVSVTIQIVLTAKGSSTGNAIISGLPFTSDSTSGNDTAMSIRANVLSGTVGGFQGFNASNTQTLTLEYTGTGTRQILNETDFNDTTSLMIQLDYQT